ncbi:hypothetical protein PENTCL1PPCAC_14578, partial [Pristionchus entomophagus]
SHSSPYTMDILALPDIFLRDLLRLLGIGDRMNLRLTCRTFEQLVANTHAGYFKEGSIYRYSESCQAICLGDKQIRNAMQGEAKLRQLLHLRSRLFSRISFGKFKIKCINSQGEVSKQQTLCASSPPS